MTVIASDDFNRADGGLGANWVSMGWQAAAIVSNTAQATSTNTVYARWAADTFPDDQYAEADITTTGESQTGVILRASGTSASTQNGYAAVWTGSWGGRYLIQKAVNGALTEMATVSNLGITGIRKLRLEVVGSLLTMYVDGVEVLSVTDTTHTSGAAGIIAKQNVGTGTVDDWSSGDLAAPPASAPTNLVATTFDDDRIDLTWDAFAGAIGYDIERSGTVIAFNHPTNSYSDTGLAPSTTYDYRVTAVVI